MVRSSPRLHVKVPPKFLISRQNVFQGDFFSVIFFSLLKNTCRQRSRYIRAPVRRLCRSSVISLQKGCLGAGHAPPSKRTKGPKRCKISVRKSSTKQVMIDHTHFQKNMNFNSLLTHPQTHIECGQRAAQRNRTRAPQPLFSLFVFSGSSLVNEWTCTLCFYYKIWIAVMQTLRVHRSSI